MADLLNRSALPAPPLTCDWDDKLPAALPMFANDKVGCCTVAALAGMIMRWSSQRGAPIIISDADVLAAYSAITGYDPADPSTDNGADMLTVLMYAKRTGIGGHKIGAFAAVDHFDRDEVEIVVDEFGGAYTGANLPLSAQADGPWRGATNVIGDDAPGSWGGHALSTGKYDRLGLRFLTWGTRQPADWPWWMDYVDEAYAIFSPDWVDGSAPAPSGLNVAALRAALAAIEGSS